MFPLGNDLLAARNEGVGLIVRAIMVSKIRSLCGPDPPTLQTDRQTEDMRSQDRALHYTASRGNNEYVNAWNLSYSESRDNRCAMNDDVTGRQATGAWLAWSHAVSDH